MSFERIMSLEERSMASLRQQLLKCNAMFLNEVWHKTHLFVKGGNENVIFETSIRKDVIAYTVLHAIESSGCYAFGGFVRGHFSGKPWKDLDLIAPNDMNEERLWRNVVRFLTFVLPISKQDIKFTRSLKTYASSRTMRVRCAPEDVVLDIDIVRQSLLDRTMRTGDVYRPVTIGSCLVLRDGEVKLRKVDASVDYWRTSEVVSLLKQGEDVKLCFETSCQNYPVFYWSRIVRMEQMGWSLLEPCINREPTRPPSDRLV